MITRKLEAELLMALDQNAAVALVGPRQVGKTTLANSIAGLRKAVYLDLEDPHDLELAKQIKALFEQNAGSTLILDEIQRLPEIFAPIRGLIDKQRRKGDRTGHFLFLGSASLDLLRQSSESLAGRIAYLELFPINALELAHHAGPKTDANTLWVRGGFPDSLLSTNDKVSLAWRKNFITTYLERDIPQLGPRIPAETLRRFWTMLAHGQGTAVNASKLAANLDVSHTTINRYLDLFVDLLLVRTIRPFSANVKKRTVRSPRTYVRDSGVLHALLNIMGINDLLSHPVIGKSWEGFVIENIASVLPPHVGMFYYRTSDGAEVDLVLEFNAKECWAIEIKKGATLKLERGFHQACQDLKPERSYLIHGGRPAAFQMNNGVTAIGLLPFMEILLAEVSG